MCFCPLTPEALSYAVEVYMEYIFIWELLLLEKTVIREKCLPKISCTLLIILIAAILGIVDVALTRECRALCDYLAKYLGHQRVSAFHTLTSQDRLWQAGHVLRIYAD